MAADGIQVQGLGKTFRAGARRLTVLSGVSAAFAPGTVTAICGPSGSGKSTLLLILGAMLHPDHGTVTVAGENLLQAGAARRSRLRAGLVGFVFQRFHLVPYLTVEQNISAAAISLDQAMAPARGEELMAGFGLLERRNHRPAALSVGEQQRAALARALYNRPRVLLADEPTGNLDAANAAAVMAALAAFAAAGGTVVLATHSDAAAARADRVLRLMDGGLR